jgi:hypothetical protein
MAGWKDQNGFLHEKKDADWNLRADDLQQQSEEMISFLYEVLK